MNPAQIHLMLNHAPVMGSLIALVILAWGLLRQQQEVIRVSFYLLIGSALLALPVYFSGEGAEEAVEHLPGVVETLIETHENWGKITLILSELLGVGALVGVWLAHRHGKLPLWLTGAVLCLGLIETGVALQTAHLGGLIRHSEIRGSNATGSEVNTSRPQEHSGPETDNHRSAEHQGSD